MTTNQTDVFQFYDNIAKLLSFQSFKDVLNTGIVELREQVEDIPIELYDSLGLAMSSEEYDEYRSEGEMLDKLLTVRDQLDRGYYSFREGTKYGFVELRLPSGMVVIYSLDLSKYQVEKDRFGVVDIYFIDNNRRVVKPLTMLDYFSDIPWSDELDATCERYGSCYKFMQRPQVYFIPQSHFGWEVTSVADQQDTAIALYIGDVIKEYKTIDKRGEFGLRPDNYSVAPIMIVIGGVLLIQNLFAKEILKMVNINISPEDAFKQLSLLIDTKAQLNTGKVAEVVQTYFDLPEAAKSKYSKSVLDSFAIFLRNEFHVVQVLSSYIKRLKAIGFDFDYGYEVVPIPNMSSIEYFGVINFGLYQNLIYSLLHDLIQ